ncbi:response regulator [Aquipseudomonas alcaligenes]|uniref:Two-component system response regulator n=1 Tax=Aquipseudomonas alcaligenes TaxID=43263 RepID=A0AA37FLR3_AQUAC|nr:two-component system response regulator [Pseudomonas alcaligenes]BCR24510.1 two-component system response regulator [Pseudomonas alcaligenes]GIZ67476.1 two-component system response regulator [Pseudomonas alcaligenes]GIZ71877.1 two-component system response regulator [Pseudomonas alcaligenes]GIZ76223.1 two-component system response regulator [Pseudomonas alcaligenes]GIZ80688.1 two-component system response regulator [Pseudomonas alcaligenes]
MSQTSTQDRRPQLLVVDDEPANLQVLRHILQEDYRLLFAKDGAKALELAAREKPELILLDVMMPGMTGYQVCAQLKATPATSAIPVIFVTALADVEDEAQGFAVGAVDYITKPVSPAIVKARVRTHLSLVRVEELRETRLQIVQRLGLAAEYKDNETGLHVIRMSHYSRVLALAAGFSEAQAEELLNAAPMHDVGKIGIPDAVLRKPGKLDGEEWEVMKQHAQIGADIIGEHPSGLLRMAREIALNHHEKWDGSGYPRGISGAEIPVEARIIAIADVFDALTSERPYKKAWPVEEAVQLLREQSGRHFDPELVELFLGQLPAILEIKERWAERD